MENPSIHFGESRYALKVSLSTVVLNGRNFHENLWLSNISEI